MLEISLHHLILGAFIIGGALGVIAVKKPVYAGLSFLLTLLNLSLLYLSLSASFIAAMQILVYAGAILVIFMFVIVLFQDSYLQIASLKPKSKPLLVLGATALFLCAILWLLKELTGGVLGSHHLPEGYGTVQSLGKALYLDFFFPFEAIILLFLVAVIGALYIGKKPIIEEEKKG